MKKHISIPLILLFFIGGSCEKHVPPTGPVPEPGKSLALVVNGLSETLSVVELEGGAVTTNATELGAWCQDITLSLDGETAYIVNSGDNNIQVLSLADLETLQWLDVGIGTNPYDLELCSSGLLCVTCFLTNSLALVSLAAGSTTATIPVGESPEGVAVNGSRAYVSNTGYAYGEFGQGTVSIVDLDSMVVIRTVSVPTNPQDVAVDSEGLLHVVCTGNYSDVTGAVVIVDPDSGVILDTVPVGGSPCAVCLAPNGTAYVSGYWGGLCTYSIGSGELHHSSSNPLLNRDGLMGLDVDGETGILYVCDFDDDLLLAIRLSDEELIAEYPVGDGPVSVAIRTKPVKPPAHPILAGEL